MSRLCSAGFQPAFLGLHKDAGGYARATGEAL